MTWMTPTTLMCVRMALDPMPLLCGRTARWGHSWREAAEVASVLALRAPQRRRLLQPALRLVAARGAQDHVAQDEGDEVTAARSVDAHEGLDGQLLVLVALALEHAVAQEAAVGRRGADD